MPRKFVRLLSAVALAFTLTGCSGAAGAYADAREAYQGEVAAWDKVRAAAEEYVPSCRDFAGEKDCVGLDEALKKAADAKLNLEIPEADKPSDGDVSALTSATEKIAEAREQVEKATSVVAEKVDAKLSGEFPKLLEEATKKVDEAEAHATSLGDEVMDAAVLANVREAASKLREGCKKWEGVEVPTGAAGIAAFSELMRLKGTLEDSISKADNSHSDYQAEESKRLAEEKQKQEVVATTTNGGKIALTGTLAEGGVCDGSAASEWYYVLFLDEPVTFEGQWPDGSTSKVVDKVQVAAKSAGTENGPCGPFEPWSAYNGQHVLVEGNLVSDDGTGKYHADVAFSEVTPAQ